MFQPPTFARNLLAGGAALGVGGLILWRILPIPESFPPFLVTALLAMGYGGYEIRQEQARRKKP
jgi:hypothetical protein